LCKCRTCGEEKDESEFYKHRRDCKSCVLKQQRSYQERNIQKLKLYRRSWYERNKDRVLAKSSEWQKANRERRNEISSEWAKRNRDKKLYLSSKRRAAKIAATPKWADLEKVADLYRVAAKMSLGTGSYHVDHIVPMVSDLVCGLHVENNLQILPREENIKKLNRCWPGSWHE